MSSTAGNSGIDLDEVAMFVRNPSDGSLTLQTAGGAKLTIADSQEVDLVLKLLLQKPLRRHEP